VLRHVHVYCELILGVSVHMRCSYCRLGDLVDEPIRHEVLHGVDINVEVDCDVVADGRLPVTFVHE